jgi:hypothetical protein
MNNNKTAKHAVRTRIPRKDNKIIMPKHLVSLFVDLNKGNCK